MSAAEIAREKRRQKLLARAGKLDKGETIGSTSTEAVLKEKEEAK